MVGYTATYLHRSLPTITIQLASDWLSRSRTCRWTWTRWGERRQRDPLVGNRPGKSSGLGWAFGFQARPFWKGWTCDPNVLGISSQVTAAVWITSKKNGMKWGDVDFRSLAISGGICEVHSFFRINITSLKRWILKKTSLYSAPKRRWCWVHLPKKKT